MKTEEIEKKKEEKVDISISNDEIGFLNFLRFIIFTILATFKSFVIISLIIINSPTCDVYGDPSIKRN